MILNIGLCLCGGGAKGAYQAGVIKALYDRGINKFNSIPYHVYFNLHTCSSTISLAGSSLDLF